MEVIIVTLIIVSGFSFVLWLFVSHIHKLEVFIKARDLAEAKKYEEGSKIETVGPSEPESLSDMVGDMKPEEIRQAFKK